MLSNNTNSEFCLKGCKQHLISVVLRQKGCEENKTLKLWLLLTTFSLEVNRITTMCMRERLKQLARKAINQSFIINPFNSIKQMSCLIQSFTHDAEEFFMQFSLRWSFGTNQPIFQWFTKSKELNLSSLGYIEVSLSEFSKRNQKPIRFLHY